MRNWLAPKMKRCLALFLVIPEISVPYLPSDFDDDLAEAGRQFRSIHEIGKAVVGTLKARGRSDEQIMDVLAYVIDHPDEFPAGAPGKAVGALGLLDSTNAFVFAESFLDSNNPSLRWQATMAYRDLAFSRHYPGLDAISRLQTQVNGLLTHGSEVRNWIYDGFEIELRRAGPKPNRQKTILRFLLHQATHDPEGRKILDEILCREVPKWRASPQRAENAAKMIREHPDDARLVAFFESVRTNALESARVAVPAERHDSAPTPVTTNLVSEAGLSAVPDGDNAASDPWADLLVDLPEKKPWVPPPGWEPPF